MRQLGQVLENETVTLVRILEQIRRDGPLSQVEIGHRLGLGRAIVNVHVKKLLAQNVVVTLGSQEKGVGRPRLMLDLNRAGQAVLGISLDAPYLNGAIMDFSNQILLTRIRDVRHIQSLQELSSAIVELVNELLAESQRMGHDIFSVCFSVPGVLEPGVGRVVRHVNMPAADGLHIKELLTPLLDVPIYVVPLAAAIYWEGLDASQAGQSIFHVIWDVGIGMMFGKGFEVGFRHFKKRDAMAVTGGMRDIGHTVLRPEGRTCHCGRKGCIEAYFGGWAMTDVFNDQSEKPPVTFEQFLHMARDEHPQVVKMLKRKARRLGETLGWIFAVHQPDRIKLSGHIPDAAPYVCDAFWYGVKRRLSREGDTSLEYLQNVRTLGLCGSCRMALHIRFNEPLLGIVSDDQVQSHESLMSQSF